MFRLLKEYRIYILFLLFILIPIISIDTKSRSPREYNIVDRFVLTLTWPIQTAISYTLDEAVFAVQNYLLLFRTKSENQKLIDENRSLRRTIAELTEFQIENERLKLLLNFKEALKLDTTLTRVIAKDVSSEYRTIRLNRGDASGILKDMAVVVSEGVIGRILRTTSTTADVVTVLDPLSALDVVDSRSRARGIVVGLTPETLQMRFALRTDDIQVGDILLTSGLGGIFPRGIPVGKVSKVDRKAFGITQSVEVTPSADFSKLEEVLVLKSVSDIESNAKNNLPVPIASKEPSK